jgi:hypothetical protein
MAARCNKEIACRFNQQAISLFFDPKTAAETDRNPFWTGAEL